jgi:hypothetical protein
MSTQTDSQRKARAHNSRRNRRLKGMGLWQDPYVPSEPVRQHLHKIHEQTGMPFYAISQKIGLPHESSLQNLLWGKGGSGPSKTVSRETAELVMAYWPSMDDLPPTTLIDATGTRRRVEALAVRGWSRNWVARQIGMTQDAFRKATGRAQVTVGLARLVAAAYDEWWDQDPLDHGYALNPVAITRAGARRAGWHGPLAWDDDTIDNPSAMPVTDALQPSVTEGGDVAARWLMGESVVLDRTARREVLAHLFEWTNDTTAEIAARLEMTPEAADRQWHRMKERAAAEGRRLWRRVYVPRERNMNQTEMEEAA